MKYVPVNLDKNVNISDSSEWIGMLNLLGKIAFLSIIVYLLLGFLVELIIPYIPQKYELNFSDLFVKGIEAQYGIDKKHNIKKIQHILDKLVKNMDNVYKFDYQIIILKDGEPNALAYPGGKIVIFSSLIDEIKSENELAMILGHELGHFVHKDHLKSMGRSLLFLITSTIFFGANSSISAMILKIGNGINNRFSQSQEMAADLYGLELLNKTYGNVAGATDFFKRLEKKVKDKKYLYFFNTHPYPRKRIERLDEIINDRHYKIGKLIPFKDKDSDK